MIYLYIKTHQKTGLKYFGKTTRNPINYKGSGKYWKSHIKKHGNCVDTKIIGTFDDEIECCDFALRFSLENNIVDSIEWANLINENGLDGAPKGNILSAETKQKISKSLLGKPSIKTKYVCNEIKEERTKRLRKQMLEQIWINNGIVNKRTKSKIIPEGWIAGRIQNGNIGDKNIGKRNDGSNTKGKVIYNNGAKHAYYYENCQPEGWSRGKMLGYQGGTGNMKKGKKYGKK
jgi:hypothetical protein